MSRSRSHFLFSILGLASALSVPYSSDSNPDAIQTAFHVHKPADLPHTDPTHSFWTHSPGANPLAGEGSTGALTDEADVCIIGSGITGVSAAYHLANAVQKGTFPILDAKQKLRAVILEARDFCKYYYCSGATGRNGGNLTPYEFSGFSKVESRLGREAALRGYALEHYSATEMVRLAREGGWADEVDLVEGGHLDVALTEARLEEMKMDFTAAVAAGKSVNVSWLSREEMNATFGTYNWGVSSPGYNLWPLKFVTQLFKQTLTIAPQQLDLRLHTRTPVTSVSPSSLTDSGTGRRWALTTARGPVHCSTVLHATNGYASHLLPHMAGLGPAGIVPVRGQVIALRAAAPLDVLSKRSWVGNEGYWFPRPVTETEQHPLVILGGARTAAGPPFGTDVTDDGVVDEVVGSVLRDFLPMMFPGRYEPGREPEAEWTGIMGYTALEIPFVGPVLGPRPNAPETELEEVPYYKGQYIAAGYSGHGMPRAYACAEVVVQMIADEIAGRGVATAGVVPQAVFDMDAGCGGARAAVEMDVRNAPRRLIIWIFRRWRGRVVALDVYVNLLESCSRSSVTPPDHDFHPTFPDI
ncbi:DAO domain-containing protein [Mycena venus]|uniref:DAO domain-containing protein n=1 Tax=Mycena venus TaxID=2733690 RepID=A0A8H6Y8A6_9AGAR|nr:DAO domain-containing protein [Mycena venus]